MPLILAIESDRRQAAQLTAIARSRLKAEIVLSDSAERGLQALGDRIPDLILTPALLSPRDEGALTEHLRQLNTRAAHVQTLTVPVLADTANHGSMGRSVLSALRRDKGGPAIADGCDPEVFAEQVHAYLERAAMELEARPREHTEPKQERPEALHVQVGAIREQATEPVQDDTTAAPAIDVQSWQADWAVPEIAAAVAEMSAPEPVTPERILEVTSPPAFEPRPRHHLVEPVEFAEVDLGAMLEEYAPEAVAPVTAAPRPVDVPVFAPRPADPLPSAEATIMEAVAAVGRLTQTEAPAASGAAELRLPSLTPEPVPAPTASQAKRDRRAPLPTMKTTVQPPKKKVRRPKPLQDEWGLFDPAKCGFAALVARLEEVTGTTIGSDHGAAEKTPDPNPRGTRVAR